MDGLQEISEEDNFTFRNKRYKNRKDYFKALSKWENSPITKVECRSVFRQVSDSFYSKMIDSEIEVTGCDLEKLCEGFYMDALVKIAFMNRKNREEEERRKKQDQDY